MQLIHMVFSWRMVLVKGIHLDISSVELNVDMFTVLEPQETGIHV